MHGEWGWDTPVPHLPAPRNAHSSPTPNSKRGTCSSLEHSQNCTLNLSFDLVPHDNTEQAYSPSWESEKDYSNLSLLARIAHQVSVEPLACNNAIFNRAIESAPSLITLFQPEDFELELKQSINIIQLSYLFLFILLASNVTHMLKFWCFQEPVLHPGTKPRKKPV